MLNSPSTPTSSTSTRAPATVDGSTRPIEDIRADIEHPYVAALLAVGGSSIGDGPIGRLLHDVAPLLAVLDLANGRADLAEKRLGECIGCNYNDGPDECCPQHGRTVTEWIDIASTVIGRQHAIEADRDAALARLAAQKAARIEERRELAAALARIAAVEARVAHWQTLINTGDLDASWFVVDLRAALAASPTPTGPEPEQDIDDDAMRAAIGLGPATPGPTEETRPSYCGHTVEEGCTGHGDF